MEHLTPKQVKFAEQYIETGNATEAVAKSYEVKNRAVASSIGSENLRKPEIRAYLSEKAHDAASMIYKLSQEAVNENVRLNASKDILDRTGYKPPETTIQLGKQLTISEVLDRIEKENSLE